TPAHLKAAPDLLPSTPVHLKAAPDPLLSTPVRLRAGSTAATRMPNRTTRARPSPAGAPTQANTGSRPQGGSSRPIGVLSSAERPADDIAARSRNQPAQA